MLRWLALLLLLSNALLLLWYAQQREEKVAMPAINEIKRLRLLHELGGGEVLRPRKQVCYAAGDFVSRNEAIDAQAWLQARGVDSELRSVPAAVIGYRLRLQRPADSDAQLALLDQLALAGWVPQTEAGHFVLGPFLGDRALQQAQTEQEAIGEVLKLKLDVEPIRESRTLKQLWISMPEGAFDPSLVRSSMAAGWPGMEIEKKSCERVAHPQ